MISNNTPSQPTLFFMPTNPNGTYPAHPQAGTEIIDITLHGEHAGFKLAHGATVNIRYTDLVTGLNPIPNQQALVLSYVQQLSTRHAEPWSKEVQGRYAVSVENRVGSLCLHTLTCGLIEKLRGVVGTQLETIPHTTAGHPMREATSYCARPAEREFEVQFSVPLALRHTLTGPDSKIFIWGYSVKKDPATDESTIAMLYRQCWNGYPDGDNKRITGTVEQLRSWLLFYSPDTPNMVDDHRQLMDLVGTPNVTSLYYTKFKEPLIIANPLETNNPVVITGYGYLGDSEEGAFLVDYHLLETWGSDPDSSRVVIHSPTERDSFIQQLGGIYLAHNNADLDALSFLETLTGRMIPPEKQLGCTKEKTFYKAVPITLNGKGLMLKSFTIYPEYVELGFTGGEPTQKIQAGDPMAMTLGHIPESTALRSLIAVDRLKALMQKFNPDA